jgi:hypothetical protein
MLWLSSSTGRSSVLMSPKTVFSFQPQEKYQIRSRVTSGCFCMTTHQPAADRKRKFRSPGLREGAEIKLVYIFITRAQFCRMAPALSAYHLLRGCSYELSLTIFRWLRRHWIAAQWPLDPVYVIWICDLFALKKMEMSLARLHARL